MFDNLITPSVVLIPTPFPLGASKSSERSAQSPDDDLSLSGGRRSPIGAENSDINADNMEEEDEEEDAAWEGWTSDPKRGSLTPERTTPTPRPVASKAKDAFAASQAWRERQNKSEVDLFAGMAPAIGDQTVKEASVPPEAKGSAKFAIAAAGASDESGDGWDEDDDWGDV